jgi:hypothetical protein
MQKLTRTYYKFILFLFIIFFTISCLTIKNVSGAPEKIMEIITEEEIYEEKNFSISVLDPDLINIQEIETPYLSDVQIEFNEMIYFIDEDFEVTIKAPEVTQNEIFTIKASKDGYITAYKNVTIIDTYNNKLEIIHDDYVVDAGKKFSVQIIDGDENLVSGVEVYIQNSEEPSSITNERGFATLKAPDDKENFIIVAKKNGYDYVTQIFSVNIPPSLWDSLIKNQYIPIFIGVILLISAIIFVNFRQRLSIYNKSKEISDEKNLKKYNLNAEVKISTNIDKNINDNKYYSRDIVRSQQAQDVKVEEIRITRPNKEKEIIPIKTIEDETDKIINRRKLQKNENDWFKGNDDIRYEIDKLTGEVDENTVDKWFEGFDDIKDKVNEKIKKKDKNKDKT